MIPHRTKVNQFAQIHQALEANFSSNSDRCSTHNPSNNQAEKILPMISIFAKSEKKKKNDEGMIMTTEEEEIKRRKKEKKENKRRNQNKVCRKSGLGEIVLKQFSCYCST